MVETIDRDEKAKWLDSLKDTGAKYAQATRTQERYKAQRNREVAQAKIAGASYREVAEALGVSRSGVQAIIAQTPAS